MKIKTIIDEDCQNYKKISFLIGAAYCTWKCCKECGEDVCQNIPLAKGNVFDIDDQKIVNRYMENTLSNAIIFGGLEPMDQFSEMYALIAAFRLKTADDIVIYTGYNEDEIEDYIKKLQEFPNIIIKFGRFVPSQESKYDSVLGVALASPNQYARRIS